METELYTQIYEIEKSHWWYVGRRKINFNFLLRYLAEFERPIKPNGTLVLFVPVFQFLWGLQDEVGHHKRHYTAHQLKNIIDLTEFKIKKLTYVNLFLFPMIWVGHILLRLIGNRLDIVSENDLSPAWSNRIRATIFSSEAKTITATNLQFGTSMFCIAQKS